MPKLRRIQTGLTMIEVLVSLMIFLVVLLAVYQLFDTSHATYLSGTRRQDVQQQARLAVDEIARKVRMAGYVSENYDGDAANNLSDPLRIHIGTGNFLAVFGNLDDTAAGAVPESGIFVFCQTPADINGRSTLIVKRSTDTTVAPSYTCNNGELLADNVTDLRFAYTDENGNQIAAPLDGQAVAAAPNLGLGANRVQREAVRAILIRLTITETVPRQSPQVYSLTSTVRLRNLNNSL
jgi:prepilin-type N-terminal cleavage/methylation domain-containing protein